MKVVLIDDEILVSDYLENLLLQYDDIEVVGKFTNTLDGLKFIQSGVKIDVVFTDIWMPGYSGLKLAKDLRYSHPNLSVVFITDYVDYAIRAFEVQATDFIVKPVLKERLKITVDRVQQKISKSRPNQRLYITMFQKVNIVLAEDELVPIAFKKTKIQQLFLYLLHHRSKRVEKAKLIELFWGNLEPKQAISQLYNAIYMIRKKIEPFDEHLTITSYTGFYQLNVFHVLIDVDHFESSLSYLSNLNESSIEDYKKVLKMYTGHYLQGYDDDWIVSERYRLQDLWLQLALQVMRWYEIIGDEESLKALCISSIYFAPLSEKSYFYLMKMSENKGENSSVYYYYSKLQEILDRELNEKPSEVITIWYKKWKRELSIE